MTESTSARTPQRAGTLRDRLIGVFRTLADQHSEAAEMLAQLQQEPGSRAMQCPIVRRALVAHEQGEVRELYPVLRQFEATRALAEHHDEEARELDALVCRLDTIDINSDVWGEVLDILVRTVLHHAKEEEEQKVFPTAQQTIGEARAIELDAKVLLAWQKIGEQQ